MFLLRKKKSGYPKDCIMFAEKTDSESSCLLFEKEKLLSERMHYVCRKYALRRSGKGTPFRLTCFLSPLGGGAPLLSDFVSHFPRFNGGIHLRG